MYLTILTAVNSIFERFSNLVYLINRYDKRWRIQ